MPGLYRGDRLRSLEEARAMGDLARTDGVGAFLCAIGGGTLP